MRWMLLLLFTIPTAMPWTAGAADFHSLADMESVAIAAVRAQYATNADLELDAVPLDRRLRLARCPQALTAEPQRAAGGVVSVKLRCSNGNGWSVYAQVRVREFRRVLVLNNVVAAETPVTVNDVRAERRDVAVLAGGYYESLDALGDLVAARRLAPDTVLTPAMLAPPTWVERNQQVRIVAMVGSARIVGAGIALEPGAEGELVRARNTASGRVVQGRVIGPGEIRVGG